MTLISALRLQFDLWERYNSADFRSYSQRATTSVLEANPDQP